MTVKQKGGHPVCLGCGCKLIRFNWNEKVDVPVCNNRHCSKYRQPAGTVEAVSEEVNKDSKIDWDLWREEEEGIAQDREGLEERLRSAREVLGE